MNRVFPVEIRDFLSLNDLSTFVDKSISWYEASLNEYNRQLGDLLREQGQNSEELAKRLAEKGLARQGSQKGKKSEASASQGWFSFKGLMLSAEKQNKAEVFFEAVDKIKNCLEKLKEAKILIGELQKAGLGPDIVYSTYFVEGIPEKIFVEPAGKVAPRYKFEIFFSTSMESLQAAKEVTAGKTAPGGVETAKEEKPDEKEKQREKGEPEESKSLEKEKLEGKGKPEEEKTPQT